MSRWWSSRTPRVKTLLAAGAILLLGLLIWQFALGPALHRLDEARLANREVRTDLQRLERLDAMRGAADRLYLEAAQLAEAAGLSSAEIVPGAPGEIRAVFREADPARFFLWTTLASDRLGLYAEQVEFAPDRDGLHVITARMYRESPQ